MIRQDIFPAASAFAAAAAIFIAITATPSAASAASGAPPFCVMRGGGGEGGSGPQICSFWDYQQCLQAAADLHGNCVQNIDYHGAAAPSAAPVRTRHRR